MAGLITKVYDKGVETQSPQGPGAYYHADLKASEIDPNLGTVEGRMDNLMQHGGRYLERARHAGEAYANRRGMLNSSIGAGASEAAAIDAALPIAQQDAGTYAQYGLNEQAQGHALAQNLQMNELSKDLASHEGEIRGGLIDKDYEGKIKLEGVRQDDEMQQLQARLGADMFARYTGGVQALDAGRLAELNRIQMAEGWDKKKKENAIAEINATYEQSFEYLKKLYEMQGDWTWDF